MISSFKERKLILYFFLYNLPLILFFHKINLQQIQIFDLSIIFFFHSLFFLVLFLIINLTANILKANKDIFLFVSFFFYYLIFYYYSIKNQILNILNNIIQLGFFLDFFILLSYFLVFIFLYRLIIKQKYFNAIKIFTAIFLLLNYSIFIFQIFTTYSFSAKKNYLTNNVQVTKNQGNIYYIIFDGMTSLDNAERNNIINNQKEIENRFKNLNATYIKNSISNYSSTYLSLASIFDLDYPVKEINKKYKNRFNFFPYMLTHGKNSVLLLDILQQVNKKMFWVGNNWAPCNSQRDNYIIKCNQYKNKYLSLLLNFYSISPLKKVVYFFTSSDEDLKFISNPKKYLNSLSNNNSFFFIHLLIPHDELLDSNCNIIKNKNKVKNTQFYKAQYSCSINKIYEILESINSADSGEKIVIISGDHGWHLSKHDVKKPNVVKGKLNAAKKINFIERSKIFNLIVAPERCKLRDSILFIRSPINNMRFALNCMHGINLPYLDNEHFVSFYETSKSYGQVIQLK